MKKLTHDLLDKMEKLGEKMIRLSEETDNKNDSEKLYKAGKDQLKLRDKVLRAALKTE